MAEGSTASARRPPAHRRRYLVDRAFQLKYALLMAAAGLAVALVFGLWLHQAHAQATALLAPDPETRELVEHGERMLFAAFAVIALLLAAALGLLGVVVTHRVAGPLLVMSRHLEVLAKGRFPRPRALRRGDELAPFFQAFAGAVDRLAAREAAHVAVLEEAVERLRPLAGRVPDAQPVVDALSAAARERRAALSQDELEPTPVSAAPIARVGA